MQDNLPLSERWAAYVATNFERKKHWRYAWCVNVAMGILFGAIYLNGARTEVFMLVLSVLAFGQAIHEFEREGFLRLIAAKNAEIAELQNRLAPKA